MTIRRVAVIGACLLATLGFAASACYASPGGGSAPATASSPAASSPAFAAGPPPGRSWHLSFAEEFNGSSYDPTKLTPCFDWNYGSCTKSFNNGRESYEPSQVRVAGGLATLTAEPRQHPTSGCGHRTCTYKSGLLSTARPSANGGGDYLYAFRYGYVEARMQIPDVRGIFSAFWMLPADPSFRYRSEIDILENLGTQPSTIFQTYHYSQHRLERRLNRGYGRNGTCAAVDYSKGMHRYGVDWQPDAITFYVDGVACGRFTDARQIENGPMQIIVNVMVDNDWQRSVGLGLQDPRARGQLKIDYLRVYQAS